MHAFCVVFMIEVQVALMFRFLCLIRMKTIQSSGRLGESSASANASTDSEDCDILRKTKPREGYSTIMMMMMMMDGSNCFG